MGQSRLFPQQVQRIAGPLGRIWQIGCRSLGVRTTGRNCIQTGQHTGGGGGDETNQIVPTGIPRQPAGIGYGTQAGPVLLTDPVGHEPFEGFALGERHHRVAIQSQVEANAARMAQCRHGLLQRPYQQGQPRRTGIAGTGVIRNEANTQIPAPHGFECLAMSGQIPTGPPVEQHSSPDGKACGIHVGLEGHVAHPFDVDILPDDSVEPDRRAVTPDEADGLRPADEGRHDRIRGMDIFRKLPGNRRLGTDRSHSPVGMVGRKDNFTIVQPHVGSGRIVSPPCGDHGLRP